jgi:HK97 family phage major capsid protein
MSQHPADMLLPVNPEIRESMAHEVGFLDQHREAEHAARLTLIRSRMRTERQQPVAQFPSLLRSLSALVSGRPVDALERAYVEENAASIGQAFDRYRQWWPLGCLTQPVAAMRAMASQPGSSGGYLVGTETLAPADALRGDSVLEVAGIQTPSGFTGNVSLPVLKTSPTVSTVAEGVAPSATEPVWGQATASPKTCIAVVPISGQLVKQYSDAAEQFLRTLLLRTLMQSLARLVVAGAGGTEPLGVLNMPGVHTQSGSTLAHAGLLAMREAVLTAGAREDSLLWVGAPDTQELLGARERGAAEGARFLWDDDGVLGRRAIATKNTANGSLVVGDWSQLIVPLFGAGVRIDVDTSTLWNSGGLQIRAILLCDVLPANPAAFAVAKSIT